MVEGEGIDMREGGERTGIERGQRLEGGRGDDRIEGRREMKEGGKRHGREGMPEIRGREGDDRIEGKGRDESGREKDIVERGWERLEGGRE